MVRLKVAPVLLGAYGVLFQFQNGTIKSVRVQKKLAYYMVFQFQNGTIKRTLSLQQG